MSDSAVQDRSTMTAAVFHAAGDIRVERVEAPAGELSTDEVLVRPLYAGICGTDLHEYRVGPDLIPTSPHPLTGGQVPQILGHEFSAVVVAVGEQTDRFTVGDLVALRPGVWCGSCRECTSGLQTSCAQFAALGLSHRWGGLAELALVRAEQVVRMPAGVTPEQAALMEPASVAGLAFATAGLDERKRVLITGGGPIGALIALHAHAQGSESIVVSEPSASRRAQIEALGVANVVDPREPALAEDMAAQFDACFEASGNQRGLDLCVTAVRAGGVIVQTGLHPAPVVIDITSLNHRQVRLEATWCWPPTGWEHTAKLVASGALPVERIITGRVELANLVTDAFDVLLDPKNNHQKILIRIP